ncbi:GNAT family N-acetyltransferase [Bosea sp. BK604]|uniref:GNAT family N-acetyltransferase n=1 Tax=Bosea sp. BK604 TaxID=2512180 RepID=UPI00104499EC|nr:GNAT family N-acetyltransferase [Bosea sp. BK604]TCR66258.1 ribosomal protein S18 acetylase RimI-like enzyme [Bosea sp. BK604]
MSEAKVAPSEITIRPARREDVRRVATLIMLGAANQTMTPAEIEAEAAHPSYEQSFDVVAASPDNTLFVAERNGAVIGTFQVTIIPGIISRGRKRAKFESVHVAPECRGMGVGAVMIGFAIDFARSKGAELVELTSNKARLDAHRFYRNLGFDQSHEGFKILV